MCFICIVYVIVLFSIMYYFATGEDPVWKANEGMRYVILRLLIRRKCDHFKNYIYVSLEIIQYPIQTNINKQTNKLSHTRSYVIQRMTLHVMMSYHIALHLIAVTIFTVQIVPQTNTVNIMQNKTIKCIQCCPQLHQMI